MLLFTFAYEQKQRASMSTGESSEEPRQYFEVAIPDMAINHYTHVKITGEVKSVRREKDGDTHIIIRSPMAPASSLRSAFPICHALLFPTWVRPLLYGG